VVVVMTFQMLRFLAAFLAAGSVYTASRTWFARREQRRELALGQDGENLTDEAHHWLQEQAERPPWA
jgi:hypothetical protein